MSPLLEALPMDRREECAVAIADGATWIWERVGLYFPEAIQVLDMFRAGEHVASAGNAIYGEGSLGALEWRTDAISMLGPRNGPAEVMRKIVAALRHPDRVVHADELRKELRYLFRHRHRMRYHWLATEGLPRGSGAMESAVKQLNLLRLKRPGMKWTRAGADAIVRIRAAHLSRSLRGTVERRRNNAIELAYDRYNGPALRRAA